MFSRYALCAAPVSRTVRCTVSKTVSRTVSRRARRAALAAAALVALSSLAGCASLTPSGGWLNVIRPYRIDIVQGNVVTSEQIDQIKPGMTRAQVRNVLGSPMLADIFHDDRWDYVFTFKRPGTELQKRDVVVFFDGDKVKQVDSPKLPTEQEFVASISRKPLPKNPPSLELTEAQREKLPKPAPLPAQVATAASAPAEGPLRDYPPLEPQ
jgi:outer membrane protein assembly factor BamE